MRSISDSYQIPIPLATAAVGLALSYFPFLHTHPLVATTCGFLAGVVIIKIIEDSKAQQNRTRPVRRSVVIREIECPHCHTLLSLGPNKEKVNTIHGTIAQPDGAR